MSGIARSLRRGPWLTQGRLIVQKGDYQAEHGDITEDDQYDEGGQHHQMQDPFCLCFLHGMSPFSENGMALRSAFVGWSASGSPVAMDYWAVYQSFTSCVIMSPPVLFQVSTASEWFRYREFPGCRLWPGQRSISAHTARCQVSTDIPD